MSYRILRQNSKSCLCLLSRYRILSNTININWKQLSLKEVLFLFTDFQQCLAVILITILYCNGYYIFPLSCRIFRVEFEKLFV